MNSEIASAYARFFEAGKGPSHDELTRLFQRTGLESLDPARTGDVGKLKRVRGGLLDAVDTDPSAALRFIRDLTAMLKARGCFNSQSDQYAGPAVVSAAQAAMSSVGWILDGSGNLAPASIAGLEGRALSEALQQYVRRIQRGTDDNALTVGTAKELLEAAGRHVLVGATGSYDPRADFPTTLYQACAQIGVGVPTGRMISELDQDPYRALEQAMALAALAIGRLRNQTGTGHGRPATNRTTRRQGIVTAQAAAAITYILLEDLTK